MSKCVKASCSLQIVVAARVMNADRNLAGFDPAAVTRSSLQTTVRIYKLICRLRGFVGIGMLLDN